MTEKTYPYTAWVLMPSFKPKEITITRRRGGFEEASNGKLYDFPELYSSKVLAIAAGFEKIKALQDDLDKRRENLNKRINQLEKAARE